MIGYDNKNVAKNSGLVLGVMAIILMMIVPLLTAGIDSARDEEEKYECDASADMDSGIPFDWKDDSGSLEGTTVTATAGYLYAISGGQENGSAAIAGGGSTDAFTVTLLKGTNTEATGSSSYRIVGISTGLNAEEVETIGVDNLKIQVKGSVSMDNVKMVAWFVDGDNGNWIVQASEAKEKDITTTNQNVTLDFSSMAVEYAKSYQGPSNVYLIVFFIQENTETNYMGTADVFYLDLRFYGDYASTNELGFSRIEQFTVAMFIVGLAMVIGGAFMTPWLNMPRGWGRALAGQFERQRAKGKKRKASYNSQYRKRRK